MKGCVKVPLILPNEQGESQKRNLLRSQGPAEVAETVGLKESKNRTLLRSQGKRKQRQRQLGLRSQTSR